VNGAGACRPCLQRSWLLSMVAGHLERAHRQADRLLEALALEDGPLLALPAPATGGRVAEAYERFDPEAARSAAARSGLELLCRHHPRYPPLLLDLPAPPATLHLRREDRHAPLGLEGPTVAIVGARKASDYGLDVARALGRGLSAAGVTVVSGLAYGIDARAHAGALAGGGATLGVLAGGADVPYPARQLALYRRVAGSAGIVSEMPTGFRAFRWCFLARNRIVAGLARAVIVVEASASSGSLLTARLARELGRPVGAVPGRVTSSAAAGPLALLRRGAHLVTGAQDVLDLVASDGWSPPPSSPPPTGRRNPGPDPPLPPALRRLLDHVSNGRDTPELLVAAGHPPSDVGAGLGELELGGYVRRTLDGRYSVAPP